MFNIFHASRRRYWSCTKLADWIRTTFGNEAKPKAATMEEWDEWKIRAEQSGKFVKWLADDGLDSLQNIMCLPADAIDHVRYYVKNRYIDKLQYLPTGLKPGQYADVRERMLHGMFETLVDFVEIEKTHMQLCWSGAGEKRPLRYKIPLLRWKAYRSRELGMKYLNWETTLDSPDLEEYNRSPSQAEVAREIIALYTWWKDVRPSRPDPLDASGWTAYCDQYLVKGELFRTSKDKTPEQAKQERDALDMTTVIEKQQDQEDEDMLVRLIKIRLSLWT